VAFFTDLLFIAVLVKALYELLLRGAIPLNLYLATALGLPFFLGAASRRNAEGDPHTSPFIVAPLIREGFALVTLFIFIGALDKSITLVYGLAVGGALLVYFVGRIFRFTVKLILFACGLFLAVWLASH